MDRAGLLELQRHLVGDRRSRARGPARRPSCARTSRSDERRPVAGERPLELLRAAPRPPRAARRPRATRATSASAASTEATKVLVAATLRSGPARSGSAWSQAAAIGESAMLVIATVSAPPAPALRIISTMSGLWPDCEMPRQAAPLQPQLPAVDRGDRRPDRGDRDPRRQLDRIFEIGRRVVGRAARHGDQKPRIGRAHRRRRGRHLVARVFQEPRRRRRDLGHLGLHVGHRIRHLRGSFRIGRDPGAGRKVIGRDLELGGEIVGVAAIERAGELDHPAAGR